MISKSTLPSGQYGFRRGCSTNDAILQLVTDTQICFSKNHYLGAAFLDIKGAYDSVDLVFLREKLINIGIPRRICNVMCNLFNYRKVYVRYINNSLTNPRNTSTGLPQGAVLSPLLFNIFTASLHEEINYKLIQYADDFVVYNSDKTLPNTLTNLKESVISITQKLDSLGFLVTPEKSSIMFFTRHNLPRMVNITINEIPYPVSTSVVYLGITLDKKLTWRSHVESIITKCNKGLNFLKLIRRIW